MNKEVFATLEFDKIISHLKNLPVSPLGVKLIEKIEPFQKLDFIKEQLDEVSEQREILDFDDPFPISGLQDISATLKKISVKGTFLLPEELCSVLQTLEIARTIKLYFAERLEKYPRLGRISQQIYFFKNLENEISRCVDKTNFQLFDHASPELNRLRRTIEAQERQIRKKLEGMVHALAGKGYLQENLIVVRNERLVLMVKDECRGKVKGLVHDQSATGATLFVEPLEMLELNNKIRALKIEERKEIERILLRLADLIREQLAELQQTVQAAAQFDFIYSKAVLSQQLNASQPAINDQNIMEIINGRHPLLALRRETGREVVPIDIRLGDKIKTLVISGPNAGGKTVALKTIGLLSLMTACGLHIPADPSSDIAIFKNIFATIGDQQSIENDLSTFSSHIAKLRQIVEAAKKNDLVLIDEIGSGTDPEEGASLAISILEHLTSLGCTTVISTHQGALKVFAHETELVENGSMEFNRDTLEPTYRFRLGIPGSSYAFEIARRHGLPEKITGRAQKLTGAKKNQLEELLIDLENRLQHYRTLTNELIVKESNLESLIKLYERKNEELIEKEKALKKDAIEEAKIMLSGVNATIESVIKKIKEEQASKESIKVAQEKIRAEKEKITREETLQPKKKAKKVFVDQALTKVVVGQQVHWKKYHRSGVVLSLPDSSNHVLIQTGEVKMKVPLTELFSLKQPEEDLEHKSSIRVKANLNQLTTNEIDIRGFTVAEGIEAVDKFIDEALISGLEQIYIVHGKGTGKLRQGVYRFLDQHPRVKSKSYPDWNLGDTGMTVVNLTYE